MFRNGTPVGAGAAEPPGRSFPLRFSTVILLRAWMVMTLGDDIGAGRPDGTADEPWWRGARKRLLRLMADRRPRYVYHLPTAVERARRLKRSLATVDRFYYSMKANPHPRLLATLTGEGVGVECVSLAEVLHARRHLGSSVPLLFTPNFCPVEEYAGAAKAGAEVVVDGPEVLLGHARLFRGLEIGLRVDPGQGLGHHRKVRTAGLQAKFGQPLGEVGAVLGAADRVGARIVGLHAHVGSGILEPGAWAETGRALASLLPALPDVRWLDLGGGLAVPERPDQAPLDLAEVDRGLRELRPSIDCLELRLEPGRYFVAEAGALLAPVTQTRTKNGLEFVGLAAGMNALLRPALYGAWHGIHNLTRLDDPPARPVHVVGPICESSDVLGRDRRLPETRAGDVMLIDNAGAYGAVMASGYNLREPPAEVVIEE